VSIAAAARGLVPVEQFVGAGLVDLYVARLGHATEPPRAELELVRPEAGSAEPDRIEVDLVECWIHRPNGL